MKSSRSMALKGSSVYANTASIGGYVNSACIHMYNNEIIKIYDKVQIGTPVAVTNSEKSFRQLAEIYGYKIKGWKIK
ncbi:hypothetical protein [Priestia megaterium]|uniref:hypothetical protein n=1 Tax=Priestia megaterium TaxID=1404 RepID=UPI001CDBC0C3|nr:hypothetical protein [Priestia megaterium]MCA4158033.1 hypothetical protein [Priestia megaterium]